MRALAATLTLAAGAVLLPGVLVAIALVSLVAGPETSSASAVESIGYAPSTLALRDIPPDYLARYESAGARYGIDWTYLAAIGKVESDHGRDRAAGVSSGRNAAGAEGPMQFLPATWSLYGVDGDGDGRRDPYDPADAIPAAARYLVASGAPADWARALFAYNHSRSYVAEVIGIARRYRGPGPDVLAIATGLPDGAPTLAGMHGALPIVTGASARILPSGLAAAPAAAPLVVWRIIAAGNAIRRLPYLYGGGHPDFLDATALDCSSSVSYLLHAAGLVGAQALVSGDFERWGQPGPGRWVTVFANADHVWLLVAGIRNDTGGPDAGPNATQDGPRWRVGPRSTASFVVRHPPGL